MASASTIRFLRARNREGCDIYLYPYAGDQNAGYILVDLDVPQPMVLETMRTHGHNPCVVLQTSPGRLQAWVCLRTGPLEPAVATAAGKWLARAYGGDPASTDWRHPGRLAGFTNQKPARRASSGHAPWVRLVYARAGLAAQADSLLQSARATAPLRPLAPPADAPVPSSTSDQDPVPNIAAAQASAIYHGCMQRWRIADRFPQTDWSIVDLWVARHLLSQGTPATRVETILRLASPHFPRRHHHPDDYLRRTLAHAAFPAPGGALCDDQRSASAFAAGHRAAWNPTDGERPKAECHRCPPSDPNLTHRDGPPRV
ncbi:MAG: DNA-primase RepB domain-containing protein [Acidobacteriaceae bacterium]